MIGERIKHPDAAELDEIPLGEGRIVRSGMRQLAVYRDDTGELRAWSATCPHLKCVVHWNDYEKSWDCPCHGSRFDLDGRTIDGPALDNLEPIELD
jgi:Rieske Fe-S protein